VGKDGKWRAAAGNKILNKILNKIQKDTHLAIDIQRDDLNPSDLANIAAMADTYRKRLHDLSWFMRVLNETIAEKN
jgi:hypothetical protein